MLVAMAVVSILSGTDSGEATEPMVPETGA